MIASSLVLHHQNVKIIIIIILFYFLKREAGWMYGPTQSLAQWSMSFYMQCNMQLVSGQFWIFDQVVWGM
jgi:hypothetical protein